jgi:hypothetical protein
MSGKELSSLLIELCKERIVLEFGSGGSTLIFSENAKYTISVESDRYFSKLVEKTILNSEKNKTTYMYWANIGPTKSYGQPLVILNKLFRGRYNNYYNGIFQDLKKACVSDIVFIDGRFRVACAMSSLLHIKKDFEMIIDDYFDRPEYSIISTVLGHPETLMGNTGIFKVRINFVNLDLVASILKEYAYDPR